MSKSIYTYNKLQSICKDKGVQLSWSEEEYLSHFKNTKTCVEIISSCGHSTKVQLNNLLYKNTGLKCKKCLYIQEKPYQQDVFTEYEVAVISGLQKKCPNLELKRTREGCLADFCVRPKDIHSDEWLPIQLKTTKHGTNKAYSFSLRKNDYSSMLILAVFRSPDNFHKYWLIPGKEVNQYKTLCITCKYSMYDQYEIGSMNIESQLLNAYVSQVYNKPFTIINTPISYTAKQEQHFFNLRECILPNLKFEYPETPGGVTDCIINNVRVQDKVITSYKRNQSDLHLSYMVNFYRKAGNNKFQRYTESDNEFYWFHLPDRLGAYIISSTVLMSRGYLSPKGVVVNEKSRLYFSPYRSETCRSDEVKQWNNYLYMYSNPNCISKIETLFKAKAVEIKDDKPYSMKIQDTYTEVIHITKKIFRRLRKMRST